MPSLGRRDPTFVAERLHFIKIIVADTKDIEMLKIPTNFTKQHGDSLSNTLCLRVPNGGMWKVSVARKDGEVWLQNGWKEFAQYYSLEYGSLLVFRCNGNSNFWVLIFDKTASEIDYPFHNIQCEEPDLEEIDCRNDLPIQILDEWSTHASPHQMKKTSETQNGANLLPSDSRFATTDTKSNMLKLEKSRRDLGVRNNQLMLKDIATAKAIEPGGRSNPSFNGVMSASYMRARSMNVPGDFVKELTGKSTVTVMLKVAGKMWPVDLIPYKGSKSGKLSAGFSAFLRENDIGLGDECVLELIDKDGGIVNVTIIKCAGKK